jgi:hypothetical protein
VKKKPTMYIAADVKDTGTNHLYNSCNFLSLLPSCYNYGSYRTVSMISTTMVATEPIYDLNEKHYKTYDFTATTIVFDTFI